MLRHLTFAFIGFLAAAVGARATSVIAPTFAELVAEADAIHRGEVTAVEARKVPAPDGREVIKTFVTFAVTETLKGPARDTVTLEFLGGTVGRQRLTVSGMPRFNVGDRDFVFVQGNGAQFCPLVAVMHGRYRVQRDAATARDYIARADGRPLADLAEIQLPMGTLPAAVRAGTGADALARALTPADFAQRIAAQVALTPPARARPN